ncbi:unnamed protein product [Clavelina lepadiformis]|uniref:Fibrinogen C-terminal domain-containing protein n=1 Tax=Clavelina lepadiformis TaxID=159417 RepID=A0ABP0F3N4_CLALP
MIREEILEAREELPSARAVTSIQNDVNRLQKEVLVMNNGIQHINLRIAEETSIKKDNDLDIQLLENKILNQSVRYLELKQEHERLKNDHNALRAQLLRQSDVIESLRQIVESLAVGSREVIPVEELASRQHDQPLKEVRRPPTTSAPLSRGPFRDCTEAQRAGHTTSGVFRILVPRMRRRIKVWCDFEQDPGGWTTIQSRVGEKVNFYRNMAAYKKGFGDKKKQEFWLGLENIHRLTNQTEVNYKLHIDLEDWDGRRTFVEYESFRVESERDGYKLKITHYSGNAGDALTPHNNMKFTARDLDRDLFHENCAQRLHGGWWYKACGQSNLNGFYHK